MQCIQTSRDYYRDSRQFDSKIFVLFYFILFSNFFSNQCLRISKSIQRFRQKSGPHDKLGMIIFKKRFLELRGSFFLRFWHRVRVGEQKKSYLSSWVRFEKDYYTCGFFSLSMTNVTFEITSSLFHRIDKLM